MKNIVLLFSWIVLSTMSVVAQSSYRKITNEAFQRGEKLGYRIHYGFIDAVNASIEITPEKKQFNGRNTLHVVGTGTSRGTFDFFFKVRDRYESYIDEEALIPWFFGRRIDEGGYKMAQDYAFNHQQKKVSNKGKTYAIWENAQDMISGFFLARTMDLGSFPEGHIFSVPTIVDGEMYTLQIKFKGKEIVKTDFGQIRCLKFVPVLQKGRIFKKEEDMVVWLSDDKNHIPIRAKADILFGSIKVDITSYQGLVNPLVWQ
jgi:Protein of unknown function (DUF3108)